MQDPSQKDFSFTGYNHRHLETARMLRKNMTRAEAKLWYDYCRKSKYKFYRQRAIDQFIVDFYCSAARLVIEIDGAPHFTTDGKQYDSIRTEVLERYGLQVVRFSNQQVLSNFPSVCEAIEHAVRQQTDETDDQ
ncbi:MAG: endonuclease domain-containing protein [Clostridia bacterium]|nr:endonuclease domain-containing protein [Clostridia bacterium]